MAENGSTPARRRLLVGGLAVLLLVAVGVAAVAVLWYTVLDDISVPEIVTIGDDEEDAGDRAERREERGDGDGAGEAEQELVWLLASKGMIRFLNVGESARVEPVGVFSDGTRQKLDPSLVTFTNSDPSIIKVSSDGTVTAVGVGNAEISLKYQGLSNGVLATVYGNRFWFPPFDPTMAGTLPGSDTLVVLNRVMVELKATYTSDDADAIAAEISGQVLHSFSSFPGHLLQFNTEANSLTEVLTALELDARVNEAYPDELVETTSGTGNYNFQGSGTADPAGFAIARRILLESLGLQPVKVAIIDSGILFPIQQQSIEGKVEHIQDTVNYSLNWALDWSVITPFNIEDDLQAIFDALENDDNRILSQQEAINEARLDLIQLQQSIPENWEGALKNNSPVWRSHGTAVSSVFVKQINVDQSTHIDPVIDYEMQVHFAGGSSIVESGRLGKVGLKSRIEAPAVTAALEYIEANKEDIDIVNMSFTLPSLSLTNFDKQWLNRIKAMNDNILFVIAAGNGGKDASDVEPANWSLETNNIITVGATDATGSRRGTWTEGSSNHGNAVLIAAPGVDVTVIDTMSGIANNWAGTSFAAPKVVAAVSMLRAIDPSANPSEIIAHVTNEEIAEIISICTEAVDPCPSGKEEEWKLLRIDRAVSGWLNRLPAIQPLPAEPTPTPTPSPAPMIEFELPQYTLLPDNPQVIFHVRVSNPGSQAQTVYLDSSVYPVVGGNRQDEIKWFDILDMSKPVGSDRSLGSKLLGTAGSRIVLPGRLVKLLPGVNIPAGGSIRVNYIFLRSGDEWGADKLEVDIALFQDEKGDGLLHSKTLEMPGVTPWSGSAATAAPAPTAVAWPTSTSAPALPAATQPSASCPPLAQERTDWDPQYRYRTIEVRGFNKPVYENLELDYMIANPMALRDTFYLETKVLSHPGLFDEFNGDEMSPLDIQSGHAFRIEEIVHIDGEGSQETIGWQRFDYDCQFQMEINIYADPFKDKLLDSLLVTISFDESSDATFTAERQQVGEQLAWMFECFQRLSEQQKAEAVRLLVDFRLFNNSEDAGAAFAYYSSFADAARPLIQQNPNLLPLVQSAISQYCGGS